MLSAINENIHKLRVIANMNQEEFSEIAGVTRGAISQWERGNAIPRMEAIQRLSEYFDIPKSWIIEDGGMDGVTHGVTGKLYRAYHGEPIELSNDERKMIVKLRNCPDGIREAIDTILNATV
mgnify:CR=1 FL=1